MSRKIASLSALFLLASAPVAAAQTYYDGYAPAPAYRGAVVTVEPAYGDVDYGTYSAGSGYGSGDGYTRRRPDPYVGDNPRKGTDAQGIVMPPNADRDVFDAFKTD